MVKYKVILNTDEQEALGTITCVGKNSARKIKRANILLMTHTQLYTEEEISAQLSVSMSTIYRTKRYFVEYGLDEAIHDDPRTGQPRKLDANQEALLIAITCSSPPEGRYRCTLSMLGEQLVSLTELDNISSETIRQRLKENDLKPWQKKMRCIGKLDAAYIARMEHILDLYAEPSDSRHPIVNFDEAGKQLVKQVNEANLMKPGRVTQEDYEYERVGMTNIFMFFDRHRGWRKTKITEKKTAINFAECMRELVDQDYPCADVVRVVLDNFGTHNEASLYKAFPPEEARRILRRLEFHYTPKHASWLNMAEIEIGNMHQQCLDRRIPNQELLVKELAAWEMSRNNQKASIKWMFNVEKAREKLSKAYTKLNCQN